jgi:Uma2 family endonuclease
MVAVRATTEQVPALAEEIARREATGQDTYDEWWDGEYRIVTGPSPEHGELLNELIVLLHPLVKAAGLKYAAPVNIGVNREDCRVPDLGVYRPDTPRTSQAFLQTAVLVVEVLSPGEVPGAKLDFYRHWGVEEYLEIDQERRTATLLVSTERPHPLPPKWEHAGASPALGFDVVDGERIVTPQGELDLRSL